MNRKGHKRPHGQLRQSQVVTTFGPGALLDLPNYSVLVGGLDHWSLEGRDQVYEPRLVEKLKRLMELPDLGLFTPPPESDNPGAPWTGITVWQFPEWFITQDVEQDPTNSTIRSRMLIPRRALTRGKFIDPDKKKRFVVPVRFVRACSHGHIGDIDWYTFVHKGNTSCRRQLWIDERGTSGDLAEVFVRCECGNSRSIGDAAVLELRPLGICDGARPWLGRYASESCGEPSRLLVRSASNAYFAQTMSVISIPDRNEALVDAVNQVWEHHLQYVDTIDLLRQDIERKPPVRDALKGFSDEEVFQEIQLRIGGGESTSTRTVKEVELETLNSTKDELGTEKPDGDFYARALARDSWDAPHMESVERVVLVHRLREVVAQLGFTRFEATAPDVDGELELGVKRADLARELTWLPATENRGEGIYIGFKKERIEAWLNRPEVQCRGRDLMDGFNCWLEDHKNSKRLFFGLPYIMLHSLSHLLLTAVSLECGYPASSIRERIYSSSANGYGILLYTGSQDAEGTLGGLVEVGRKVHQHMEAALELGRLCSNDPVCAQHAPSNTHERRFLQGAACHGCLLIAEPSCEQRNDFLDRALVVPTVDNLGAEFFER